MHFTTFLNFASLATMATAAAAVPSAFEFGQETSPASLETRTNKGFSCPNTMSYCPWTKSCSCQPGMQWDDRKGCCVGNKMTGAWPKPSLDAYVSIGIELGTFCAASPTKIVPYDAKHKYCQASLENVAFCAPKTVEKDLVKIGVGIDIDLSANIGVDLKNTCAGLSGLYLGSVVDAVALFNTNKFGFGLSVSAGFGGLKLGLFKSIKNLSCLIGLTNCNYDCVSHCTKGCGNYIDVVGKVGGLINGLVGFCVLPDVVLYINVAGKIVSLAIEGMLCVVGKLLTVLLKTFKCNC
ncbi:hypothetical protein S7711_05350 [Stachybotrys chartarum IBT 7711]|uniref:Extracellular membrane protein CFEM domain-containing protein n=1 Tax=Stachybotrys chartarum (strain CBS 109288 / IBT 7711) TaxID=1280523 RepID=A0A084B969_STACB|nr:hypothetical protein S7711_05350 [Stachybotrys chartarum IBT 7711]KFA49149.1 hypothetical protein S40293_06158 [Stachybotrys chartarum IBT 40293]KFA78210.1 hypothetical protein S40288_01362 [Stachybotrys chartarum IBT 40288]